MSITRDQLYEALVESGGVSADAFEIAERAREVKSVGIDGVLVANGDLTDEQYGKLMADWYGVAFVHLRDTDVDDDVLRILPERFARTHLAITFASTDTEVHVAVTDPANIFLKSLIEKHVRKEVVFFFASSRSIRGNLTMYHKDPKQAIDAIIQESTKERGGQIIQLLDTIVQYAYQLSASDIHIEPEDAYIVLRYRIDGILRDITDLPKEMHTLLMTRLKVLAKLATDEHNAAQDGRVTIKSAYGDDIDIRLSLVPTTDGEKAVLRLLTNTKQQYALSELGLDDQDLDIFKRSVKKPWGMILVTGPTGSGKTTTLYSALKILNKREVNIATIEDPVEYDIEGIAQIQVNTKTDLTFAKGLRSIVRQDPDIIMVGEIRDKETAGIAVNAAMTGHLVLSTLHTNDAATAFVRLQDMGIENFLISSTSIAVLAQRLVRQLCLRCIHSRLLNAHEKQLLKQDKVLKSYFTDVSNTKSVEKIRVFEGRGCKSCQQTGYSGRTGVFEVLEVTDSVRKAIMRGDNADQIRDIAVEEGMKTMLHDGIEKVITGMTTLEEVLRVIQE